MSEKLSFGVWLRKQRRSMDLSQQAFADQVGCAVITLRRIEAGTLKPSRELASLLLEKIGIPHTEREQWVRFARGQSGPPPQDGQLIPAKPKTNLPASLTSFIGREKEQTEIINLIHKYRLVTLTGSGGVGKTRLSMKVGGQMLADFADGIWLVELAALSDSALMPEAVAAVLGIATQSATPLTETLINVLREKSALLILDNSEHLLDACAHFADRLLKNCPALKVLATSREVLGIMGEAAYRVPSLGLPNIHQVLEDFRKYDSMRLFEERAQLAKTDFALTLENASSVAQICNHLDGIPLALELAAARINMLSPEQIAVQLKECFQLLAGGSRTALPRQQTIRASIDWSWNLLTDNERALFRRLAVFAGGWTLETAQVVCADTALVPGETATLMYALAGKSLVNADQNASGAARYNFHEIIRQYASEKLLKSGEGEIVRDHHLKAFLSLAQRAALEIQGANQKVWLDRLEKEIDNLRVALATALSTDVEAGLLLCSNLGKRFWENLDVREGMYWLTELLKNPESRRHPKAQAKALCVKAGLHYVLQRFDQARKDGEEAIAIFRSVEDKQGEVDALLVLAGAMQYLEGMDRKMEILSAALGAAQSIGDDWRQGRALLGLSWDTRDLQRSYEYSEKAVALFRRAGDWRMLVLMLGILGHLQVMNNEVSRARAKVSESLELGRRINAKTEMEFALVASAYIALADGDYESAQNYLLEWAEVAEELGNRMEYLWTRARLGYVLVCEGNLPLAREILSECVREFQKDRDKTGLIFALETMSTILAKRYEPGHAASLLGWAETTRKATGDLRPKLEELEISRTLAIISEELGEEEFSKLFENGHALTLDEAAALALANTP